MTDLIEIERAIDRLPREDFAALRRWLLEKECPPACVRVEGPKENKFKSRELLPGFEKLKGKMIGGTDSTDIISEGRNREQQW